MALNNNNTMNKEQTQKRILMATVISFAFFIAYDFLYLQPKQELVNQTNKQNAVSLETTRQTQVNNTSTGLNQAPVITQDSANAAPVSNDIATSTIISTVKTQKNIFEIDNFGRIAQVTLTESKYIDEEGEQLKLFTSNQLRPLEVRFSDSNVNTESFSTNVTASSKFADASKQTTTLTLTQKLSTTTLTKVLTFYPDGHYDIKASSTNKASFFITPGFRPDVIADMYADHGALLSFNDGTLNIIEDE